MPCNAGPANRNDGVGGWRAPVKAGRRPQIGAALMGPVIVRWDPERGAGLAGSWTDVLVCEASRKAGLRGGGANKPPICDWSPDRNNACRNAYYHYCQLPKDHQGDHVCNDGATLPRLPESPREAGQHRRHGISLECSRARPSHPSLFPLERARPDPHPVRRCDHLASAGSPDLATHVHRLGSSHGLVVVGESH